MTKVTVYVERIGGEAGPEQFKVGRVKNALSPKFGQVLSPDDIRRLIQNGVEVIFDGPRSRAGRWS